MKTIFTLLATFALLLGINNSVLCQTTTWQTNGNIVTPGQYLGSQNNQPLNIKTNNVLRATFTTGNAFGIGSTQGDGFRIFDPSGGPGHLDLWTSSSTQTHIRWNGSGTIQGMNSRFEMIANLNGFWYNTTTPSGRYLFNRQDAEVGRIGSNNFWRVGLNPGVREQLGC